MMKLTLFALFLLFPLMALAQNYQGMSEQDMQRMQQQMQQAGACMQNIDEARLKKLEQEARGMEKEVKALCNKGQRDQAQSKAMSFAKQMQSDSTMEAMQKCAEIMKGLAPPMPFDDIQKEASNRHVCD